MISAFTIDDYDEALALWSRSEGIGLRGKADSREGIARFLERNPGGSLVAREDGVLVGAVLCGHDGRRGYVHHLAVEPSRRRRGIGSALARACIAHLAAHEIERCHLFVQSGNPEALEFWRRVGWWVRDDVRMMSHDLGGSS